jgi:hypothetical protein
MMSVFQVVEVFESAAGYIDPSGVFIHPVFNVRVVADNLLHQWHAVTIDQVVASVGVYLKFVDDKVDRDNLVWSFDYIMALCDYDLQHYILSVLEAYPKEIGHTGPVAFHVMASRILQTSENLSQNVVAGLISMRLHHFDAENVVECVFTLRNVLKFLNYDTPNSLCPPTIMKMLTTIFRGTSVDEFRSYITTLETFHKGRIVKPEDLFNEAQAQYENLITSDRWVKTKKKASSFLLQGGPSGKTYEDGFDDSSSKTPSSEKKVDMDRKGNKIDRSPPDEGSPSKRVGSSGEEEFWCGSCPRGGRWGNHGTSGHDAWYKDFQKNMAIRKKKREEAASGATAGTQAQASFARLQLTQDAELLDGVSFQD